MRALSTVGFARAQHVLHVRSITDPGFDPGVNFTLNPCDSSRSNRDRRRKFEVVNLGCLKSGSVDYYRPSNKPLRLVLGFFHVRVLELTS
jgi:hypothetical protein